MYFIPTLIEMGGRPRRGRRQDRALRACEDRGAALYIIYMYTHYIYIYRERERDTYIYIYTHEYIDIQYPRSSPRRSPRQ